MYTFKKENGDLIQYIDDSKVVTADIQSLTAAEKTQARTNIDAINEDDLSDAIQDLVDGTTVVANATNATNATNGVAKANGGYTSLNQLQSGKLTVDLTVVPSYKILYDGGSDPISLGVTNSGNKTTIYTSSTSLAGKHFKMWIRLKNMSQQIDTEYPIEFVTPQTIEAYSRFGFVIATTLESTGVVHGCGISLDFPNDTTIRSLTQANISQGQYFYMSKLLEIID